MSKLIDYIVNNEKLINEWHWEKNNELGLYPDKLTLGSSKKAWWMCENNHIWEAVIHSRNKGVGCPYCSGRLPVQGVNDLQTSNPLLTSEWNYAKNYPLLPTDVTKCSGKKVWWICKKGHEIIWNKEW